MSTSDSAKYNDFDELYAEFMGEDEWILPECGVREELDRETLAMLRDFWYHEQVWWGEDSKLLPTATDDDPDREQVTHNANPRF